MIVRIRKRGKIISILVGALFLLVWAPWITDDYAIDKVVERLGGPDTRFDYLGEELAVRDVPKSVSWAPFGRYVTFPSEAVWFVSFYGRVKP